MPKLIIGEGEVFVSDLKSVIPENGAPLLRVERVNVFSSAGVDSDRVKDRWGVVSVGLVAAHHDPFVPDYDRETASMQLQLDATTARVLIAGLIEMGVLSDADVKIAVEVAKKRLTDENEITVDL